MWADIPIAAVPASSWGATSRLVCMQDPEIRKMAEQMAKDPSFQAITQQLTSMTGMGAAAADGQLPGAAARSMDGTNAAAPGAAAAAGLDPTQYMSAMQNVMQNPDFAKLAEDLGKKMFASDPNLANMVQTMQDPSVRENMENKMKTLKEDPELKDMIEELETGGPAAMMKCA
jgi:hypothetical protein